MRQEQSGWTRVVGALLAHLLLYLLARVLGAQTMAAIAVAVCAAVVLGGVLTLRDRHRMRRLKRGFCDDAIHYARKQRQVDHDPDFTAAELVEVGRLRRRLDFEGIYRLIAASNAAVRAQRTAPAAPAISAAQRRLLYGSLYDSIVH